MVAAIVLGIVVGIVSFIPFAVGLGKAKLVTPTSNFGYVTILLLSLLVSVIILFGATIACIVFARDVLLPFAIAEFAALVVAALALGIAKQARR